MQKTETKAILSLSGSVFASTDGAGGRGCQAGIVYYVCKTVELDSSVFKVSVVACKMGLNGAYLGSDFLYKYI